MRLTSGLISTALVTLLLAFSALAQPPQKQLNDRYMKQPTGGSEPNAAPSTIINSKEDYRIGAGDIIEVQVEDAPELAVANARISPRGTFLMPYLKYVNAEGKTPEELSLSIADQLKGKYLKNPQVSVVVKQVHSHTFFIQGAVKKPGMYQIEGKPSLMVLISAAGGLQENRGSTAYIIRELKNPLKPEELNSAAKADPQLGPSTGEQNELVKWEMLSTNISALYKGKFDQDAQLLPGDIVNIPPTDVFYVAGSVQMPGEFPLKDGTTLRQAIAMAQGPTPRAKAKNAVIFREDEKGRRQEIPVDIQAIMSNKKEDIKLQANDIIAVPDSALKTALLPILNAVGSGAGLTLGGGIIRR